MSATVRHAQGGNSAANFRHQPITGIHLASVSRPFVATAIVQLAEAGKLDLSDSVTKHLRCFRLADERYRDITIRQILDHTSGMPDVEDYEWDRPKFDNGAAERYVRAMASERLLWAPAADWAYSSMAFDMLGDFIGNVSTLSFEDYIETNILEPTAMNNSSLPERAFPFRILR